MRYIYWYIMKLNDEENREFGFRKRVLQVWRYYL